MKRAGTTLIELLLVLTILAILVALAAPQGRRAFDIVSVRAAREAAFGVAMQARAIAIARGGADLIFDLPSAHASIVDASNATALSSPLSTNVAITTDGAPVTQVRLHFDAYGIGRMTSRTFRFRRGDAEAGLTFSSFGRVRRW